MEERRAGWTQWVVNAIKRSENDVLKETRVLDNVF